MRTSFRVITLQTDRNRKCLPSDQRKTRKNVTIISNGVLQTEHCLNFWLHPMKPGSRFASFAALCPLELLFSCTATRCGDLYVLEGSAECFQSTNGTSRWTTVGAGDVVAIAGNIKHACRNSSWLPASMVIVTTSKMYKFFYEITKPFSPDQSPTPPTPDEIQHSFELPPDMDIGRVRPRRIEPSASA